LLENYISTHGKRPSPQNGRAFLSGNIEKELWGMEKTFQYHQQIFAGLELEIYNDLLKKDKIFLQCDVYAQGTHQFLMRMLRERISS
jgi:hypothetical protein